MFVGGSCCVRKERGHKIFFGQGCHPAGSQKNVAGGKLCHLIGDTWVF